MNIDWAEVASLREENIPWAAIGSQYGMTDTAIRKAWSRRKSATEYQAPPSDRPSIVGVTAGEFYDTEPLWNRAIDLWERRERITERKKRQSITLPSLPACLVFVADLHLGDSGVNYPRVKHELELIAGIPNSGVFCLGDVVNNFIGKWAHKIRLGTNINVQEEWLLARDCLRILAPRLVCVVGGNHDAWTRAAAGIDQLREIVAEIAPAALYDTDEEEVSIIAGDSVIKRVKMRHQWLGHSQWNATHAIEKASKFDGGFDIGVGAHVHIASLCRGFTDQRAKRMAVLCGTYKEEDTYVKTRGFHRGHTSAAAAVIITKRGNLIGVENIEDAADIMRALA